MVSSLQCSNVTAIIRDKNYDNWVGGGTIFELTFDFRTINNKRFLAEKGRISSKNNTIVRKSLKFLSRNPGVIVFRKTMGMSLENQDCDRIWNPWANGVKIWWDNTRGQKGETFQKFGQSSNNVNDKKTHQPKLIRFDEIFSNILKVKILGKMIKCCCEEKINWSKDYRNCTLAWLSFDKALGNQFPKKVMNRLWRV